VLLAEVVTAKSEVAALTEAKGRELTSLDEAADRSRRRGEELRDLVRLEHFLGVHARLSARAPKTSSSQQDFAHCGVSEDR
jgi:hypothetical protein